MARTAALKILIADDHAPLRQTLRAMLSPMASDIHEAASGEEAVRLFAEHRHDWVILDIQMRPVSGLEATRAIRARFPDARVVIVTQYDDEGLRAEAAQAGARAYILKDDLAALTRLLVTGTCSKTN